MTVRTVLDGVYAAGAPLQLTGTITALDGVTPLLDADTVLQTVTMTIYETGSRRLVNDCQARDIRNVNGGTIRSDGTFAVWLSAADMALLGPLSNELHVARIQWGAPAVGGPQEMGGWHEIAFVVSGFEPVVQ